MREQIERKIKSRRTGKIIVHTYDSIAGKPIQQYFRERARKKYIPHPKPNVAASKLDEHGAQKVRELSEQGMPQRLIAKTLGTTRYRVQQVLATSR